MHNKEEIITYIRERLSSNEESVVLAFVADLRAKFQLSGSTALATIREVQSQVSVNDTESSADLSPEETSVFPEDLSRKRGRKSKE